MNNLNKAAAALLLLVASFAGAETVEGTVAVVNDKPILLSEYQKEIVTALDFWSKTEPAALADPANVKKIRESTLEELITRELLVQQAARDSIKVRQREVDNAEDEIKNRFKKDEQGRDISEKEAEAAFQEQLKKEGLDYDRFRERLTRQILARKVIDEQVKQKAVPPTEQQAHDYFDKIKAYLASGSTDVPKGMGEDEGAALLQAAKQVKALSSERVRVLRILIRIAPGATDNERRRALKTAENVKKRLDAGEDFATVAKEESEDPESASRGGDIGYVLRGVASKELEKAAFSMKIGETSAPIVTEIGYNLIKVTEKHAAEAPQFDRFKDDLANFLQNLGFRQKLDSYVKELHEKAVIERHLPAGN